MGGEMTPKEESPFSPSRVKTEDLSREGPVGRSPSSLTADGDSGESKINGIVYGSTNISTAASKKASNTTHVKDSSDRAKVEGVTASEDCHMDRSIGVKKPKYSGDEGPSLTELTGYNPKRDEFDPEYDNDAEQILAEMEFKENDSETDRELKLRVLHIYNSRLDERKRRKNFILERNLLYLNPLEKELSPEDREIYQRFKVFMRFHSQEDHNALIQSLVTERKLRKKIQDLQECRAAGCCTMAEAQAYIDEKNKRELEISASKLRESVPPVTSSKVLQKINRPLNREKSESDNTESSSNTMGQCVAKSVDDWDIRGLPGAELLNESDLLLCCQNRLLPSHYLKMQEVLMMEIMKGNIHNKYDAHGLFKVDPGKVDRVYDVVMKKLGKHEESSFI